MNELLVGAEAITKRFHISRARLKQWEAAGAPVYRRGDTENGPFCADYTRLLDWEQKTNAARRGSLGGGTKKDDTDLPGTVHQAPKRCLCPDSCKITL